MGLDVLEHFVHVDVVELMVVRMLKEQFVFIKIISLLITDISYL